jgi:enoyl-CoA hydratase
MAAIETRYEEDLLVLTLNRPPVNALDPDVLDEISDTLDEAGDAPAAVIVTGTGSVFSAGADLPKVLEGTPEQIDAGIDALSRCFSTMFLYPRPLIAAINGHALAGGAVIACAADRRVMADSGGRIGAVELKAGVPLPAWALEVVRHAVNNSHAEEVIYLGHSYRAKDALRVGLVNEVVPDGALMDRARELARELATVPRETFRLTKESLRRWTAEAARKGMAATDDEVKAAWKSPEVHDAIRALLASLGGSKGSPEK